MTTMPDEGGFAFARPGTPGVELVSQDGMTLRAWFAGQAMAGLLAHDEDCSPAVLADAATQYADALIERLKR